jgi:GTP-binding protein YchF
MHISIIGSPGCGKTTLFRAFNGTTGNGSNIGVIEVPDERLDILTRVFHPRSTVYGRIEVYDLASIHEGDAKSGSIPAKELQQMRLSDALILVLRNFEDGLPANPVAEFQSLYSELMISDMVQIETRLERITKQSGKNGNIVLEQEKMALTECLSHLEEGKPLSSLSLFETEGRSLKGFQFLSRKPLMVVINCSEEVMEHGQEVAERIKTSLPEGVPVISASAKLEAELAGMKPEDQALFMAEYGLEESLRGRLIRLAFQTLGLISFLTVGDDECRAWPIRMGMNAQEAAGSIHSDLQERFIRAETVAYEDFVRYGDMAGCKKAGVWRLEGKQYIVRDGDILSIRAGN